MDAREKHPLYDMLVAFILNREPYAFAIQEDVMGSDRCITWRMPDSDGYTIHFHTYKCYYLNWMPKYIGYIFG